MGFIKNGDALPILKILSEDEFKKEQEKNKNSNEKEDKNKSKKDIDN